MKRGACFVIIGLAVTANVALAPTVALAGRSAARPGGGRGGSAHVANANFGAPRLAPLGVRPSAPARFGGPHAGVHHLGGHRGVHQFAGHQAHFARHAVPVTVFGAAPLVYYAPPVAYGPTTYDVPPVYDEHPIPYGQPTGGAISLAPSPAATTPNVIQYSTGRYELRGDGMTVPYTWVWIPNPPPAPPDAAVPDDPRPSRRSKLYRWTDEQGVVHWTDAKDSVPQAYRGRE
jgi:hypothetical protein